MAIRRRTTQPYPIETTPSTTPYTWGAQNPTVNNSVPYYFPFQSRVPSQRGPDANILTKYLNQNPSNSYYNPLERYLASFGYRYPMSTSTNWNVRPTPTEAVDASIGNMDSRFANPPAPTELSSTGTYFPMSYNAPGAAQTSGGLSPTGTYFPMPYNTGRTVSPSSGPTAAGTFIPIPPVASAPTQLSPTGTYFPIPPSIPKTAPSAAGGVQPRSVTPKPSTPPTSSTLAGQDLIDAIAGISQMVTNASISEADKKVFTDIEKRGEADALAANAQSGSSGGMGNIPPELLAALSGSSGYGSGGGGGGGGSSAYDTAMANLQALADTYAEQLRSGAYKEPTRNLQGRLGRIYGRAKKQIGKQYDRASAGIEELLSNPLQGYQAETGIAEPGLMDYLSQMGGDTSGLSALLASEQGAANQYGNAMNDLARMMAGQVQSGNRSLLADVAQSRAGSLADLIGQRSGYQAGIAMQQEAARQNLYNMLQQLGLQGANIGGLL